MSSSDDRGLQSRLAQDERSTHYSRCDSSPTVGRSGDWGSINLGQVCTKIGSGATPRGGKDVYLATGPFALIRSQNVHNEGFRHDGLAYIGESVIQYGHEPER